MPNTPRTLEQGPEAKPRNYLADMVRDYGLYGLSDKLNSPTSGIGMLVDAVGGLGNALFVQPAQSFNRLLSNGYESGNPQSAEDAFNVAGAAMVGGLAAPRPRGAVAPKEQPLVGYRGAPDTQSAFRGPAVWASSDRGVANTYATLADEAPHVSPVEMRFKNPQVVDAQGASYRDVPYDGRTLGTDQIARLARNEGHDGVVFNNIRDNITGSGDPATSYAALQPGTVYSPLTGELLYANGGRQGAAIGAAVNTAGERSALDMSHAARMQRARDMGFDTDRTWYRGGKTGRDELKPVASDVETPAIWFSNSPDRASEFATLRAHYGNMADLKADYNPSVTPAYTRGNYKTIEGLFQAPNFERMGQQMEKAKAEGYDGVVFKRINDRPGATGPSLFNSSDVLALFDGSNVRSPNAAFDPARADSANILYSGGGRPGAATGAALNAAGERQTLYHGSPHRFDPAAIEPRRGAHDTNQIWLTPQREYAESYGNVRSYDVDPGKQFVADKNAFNDALKELQDLYPNLGYSLMGDGPTKFHGDAVSRILSKAQREGYDSVKFSDLATDNAAVGNVHDQIAVFDRTRLRPTPEDSSGGVFANGGRPGAAVGAAANAAAERPGIRAYHGSPHDFDKFDMSKIGTGEGAQAYGHGLYFAEEEAVAKAYRDALGNYSDVVKWKGSQPPTAEQQAIINQLSGFDAQRGRAPDLASIRTDLTRARNQIYMSEGMPGRDPERSARDIARLTEQIAVVDGMKDLIEIKPPGRMYEVRINANPDDFLDWDKPLSQQSEKVRGALSSGVKTYTVKDAKGYDIPLYPFGQQPKGTTPFSTTDRALAERIAAERGGTFTESTMPLPDKSGKEVFGSDLVRTESARTGNGGWFTSDMLREAGIPGIKYLDQDSRTAGEGSRNYVVFDDNLIEILRKYGLLGMIGGAAVAGGLQSDQNKQTDWARKMQPGDA